MLIQMYDRPENRRNSEKTLLVRIIKDKKMWRDMIAYILTEDWT